MFTSVIIIKFYKILVLVSKIIKPFDNINYFFSMSAGLVNYNHLMADMDL